jgi:5-methylcytosine-specific restriction endonuclease McrA
MARREFSRSVKVESLKRAMRDSVIYCEMCGLPTKKVEFDHEIPDGLGGEPTLANCVVACPQCHKGKTQTDVARIAKARRQEAKNLGVRIHSGLRAREREKKSDTPLTKVVRRKPIYEDIS